MSKTEQIGCRVTPQIAREISAAAKDEGLSLSEWLQGAIARQLGRRPRDTVQARLTRLEAQMKELCDRFA